MGADACSIDLLRGMIRMLPAGKTFAAASMMRRSEGAARRIGAVTFSGAVPPLKAGWISAIASAIREAFSSFDRRVSFNHGMIIALLVPWSYYSSNHGQVVSW